MFPSYDPASLEILEQLGQVKQILQTQNARIQRMRPDLPGQQLSNDSYTGPIDLSGNQYGNPLGTLPLSSYNKSQGLGYSHNLGDEACLLSKSLEFEVSTVNSEYLLDWSIFANKYQRSDIESMIFNPEVSPDLLLTSAHKIKSRADRGINDQDALDLIDKFLINVHTKNPIFNSDDLKTMGKHIMEHGFEWDAQSCFVVRIVKASDQ
jgi:hypothetical protein